MRIVNFQLSPGTPRRVGLVALMTFLTTVGPALAATVDTEPEGRERLLASTLLGGGVVDNVSDMAVGPGGTVYVVGWTESADFPTTPGAFDRTLGGERDAFVARLSADLTTLVAATYLGGESGSGSTVSTWDAAFGLAVGADGVFLTGYTYTDDFPVTPGAFDEDNVRGGATAFVAKMGLELDTVEFATYLGESATEYGHDLALDPSGDVYVTGFTIGFDFPTTPGAYDTVGGPFEDVFVSRLSGDLSTLVFSTLIPNGFGSELALDATGDVFVSGSTTSPDYPTTPGAYDRACGSDGFCDPDTFTIHSDVFLSRLDGTLSFLEASTYLGHDNDDEPAAIALDGLGGIYVAGSSASSDFPTTPGAYQTTSNGFKTVFASRLDLDLTTLEASTLLGGFAPFTVSEGFDLVLGADRVYLTGETGSPDFPTTPDAFDRELDGGNDAIVSVLDRDLSELTFSSLLGGRAAPLPEEDRGRSLALADDGTLYVGGHTISPDFPTTPGAFQETRAGDFDGFVSWVDPRLAALAIVVTPLDPPIVIPPEGGTFRYTVEIFNNTDASQTIDFWRQIGLPGGGTRRLGARTLTVPARSSFTRTLTQGIPGGAPAGSYTFTGLVGTFPVAEASDGFSFEKSPAGAAER